MKLRYSLSMLDSQLVELQSGLADPDGHERAAYVYCSTGATASEVRLIVRALEIIPPERLEGSSPQHVAIPSTSYVRALARAERHGHAFVLVHTHPSGYSGFSKQDDREEAELFRTAYIRAPGGPHGSVIIVGGKHPRLIGRVWLAEGRNVNMTRIRVVGKRMRVFDAITPDNGFPQWADRQVRAFGPETQQLLATLHVGVAGAGGTGSAVVEQLIRLGVGHLTVIDEDRFEETNVNRVYGSTLFDAGLPKVNLAKRQGARIGTGTRVDGIQGSVCDLQTAKALRDCDVVFGCTDDHFGRMILNRLAVWYYIPVIDLAVGVDSEKGTIRAVTGRVTILLPGNACLRCRNRVSEAAIQAEVLQRRNPQEFGQRVREGYAPELEQTDPAVIMFTTGIASRAVTELIHLLTGFMGDDRATSEILERFHETDVRTNNRPGQHDCFCMDPEKWGKGDEEWFLGLNW